MPIVAPAELRLVLPGYVPDSRLSLNGRHRTHWAVTARLRREAAWHLVEAILRSSTAVDAWLAAGVPTSRIRVEVEFVYPIRRRRDEDNLFGLVKPLVDSCVARGLLGDDDLEHVELRVRVVVEPQCTETRLTLRAAESAS